MIIQNDDFSCVPISFINLAKLYQLPLTKSKDLEWLKEMLDTRQVKGTPWENIVPAFKKVFQDIFIITKFQWGDSFIDFENKIKNKSALLFYEVDGFDDVHCVLVNNENEEYHFYNYANRKQYFPFYIMDKNQMNEIFNKVLCVSYISLNERYC